VLRGLKGLKPREVKFLAEFVAPELALKHAHARAAVVIFAWWRVRVWTRMFGPLEEPNTQEGIHFCGVCGAPTGARAFLRTCGCSGFRVVGSAGEDAEA